MDKLIIDKERNEKISRELKRKFALILALSKLTKPDLNALYCETEIPKVTLKRYLSELRSEFKLTINYIRESKGIRGATGHYELSNWGIIDKKNFLEFYDGEQYGKRED